VDINNSANFAVGLNCCQRALNPVLYDSLQRNGLINQNIQNNANLDAFYRNFLGISNRGTPDDVINEFETQIFNENRNVNDIETENTDQIPPCSICLSLFENGDELRILPCRHRFHSECIDQWFRSHRTCPMCRIDVTQ